MNYIGGPLELSISLLESPPVADAHIQLGLAQDKLRWTASGRSALALVLGHWRNKVANGWVLLPDYLCWDAILPLFEGIDVRYVPISEKLVPEMEVLAQRLVDPALRAVLLVDYFGLCDLHPQLELIKSRRPDVLIAIDAVQAFSALPDARNRYPGADAIFSSPRKVLPLPDGGVVLMEDGEALPVLSSTATAAERDALYLAAGTLREAMVNGRLDPGAGAVAEALYVDLFNRHKKLIGSFVESMSPLSTEILRRTNLSKVADRRSANVAWIQQALGTGRGGGLIRPAMPMAKGPGLAFPVRVSVGHRDPLRAFLRTRGFFCPVHWPVPEEVKPVLGPVATCLATELLSLPVDQRYGAIHMDQLFNAIEQYGEIFIR